MQKENVKNYLFISGISLLILGILLFAMLSGPVRYVGIIFLIFAIVFVASSNYLKLRNSDDGRLRSRTRDQILKHQFRK
jgi:membrane protein implicated in regulation of membrane protease activity